MADLNVSFEGNDVTNPSGNANNNVNNPNDKPEGQDINNPNNPTNDINDPNNSGNGNNGGNGNDPNNNPNNNPNNIPHDLEVGTVVNFDGNDYTVAENGDIIDKEGKVFKEAKDVKTWLEENQTSDENELSIDSIKEAIGTDIQDENGKSIEFTNDVEGVKNYINSVISIKSKEIQEGAINKLFNDNPMVKQFIDYVQLNGSPKGFGEIPDRTGITLDEENESQLEAVIRMAATEFGNKSLNDNYIKFLKSSGSLYDEAKIQLDALIAHDKEVRKNIETKAQQAREQEAKELEEYWKGVNEAIKSRNINGYTLPETIMKEVNGRKVTLTLNDFYNYLAKDTESDEKGNKMTGYQKDLSKLSNEQSLHKELLEAWLMFTNGSYKDLIDMAIKEEKVKKLIVVSKNNKNKSTIKVNKPANKGSIEDIVF